MMKYLKYIVAGAVILAVPFLTGGNLSVTPVARGGTGDSSLSGILFGNGRNAVSSLKIGSNLSLSHDTLSASGGGGTTATFIQGGFNLNDGYHYPQAERNSGLDALNNDPTDTNQHIVWGAYLINAPGTLKNLLVKANAAPQGAEFDSVLTWIDRVPAALFVKLTGSQQIGMDSVHVVPVLRGQLFTYKTFTSGGSNSANISVSIEYDH